MGHKQVSPVGMLELFVFTMLNIIPEDECAEFKQDFKKTLLPITSEEDSIFYVSNLEALTAKQRGDAKLLESSGITRLKKRLWELEGQALFDTPETRIDTIRKVTDKLLKVSGALLSLADPSQTNKLYRLEGDIQALRDEYKLDEWGIAMHQIILTYNPYARAAKMMLDGSLLENRMNRLHTFISGRPMEEWLPRHSMGYQLWSGFLPELIDEINDDAPLIHFYGLTKDYRELVDTLSGQDPIVAEHGYDPGRWRTEFTEQFAPQAIQKEMVALSSDLIRYISTQLELLEAQDALRRLTEMTAPTVEDLRKQMFRLRNLVTRLAGQQGTSISSTTWDSFASQLDAFLKG